MPIRWLLIVACLLLASSNAADAQRSRPFFSINGRQPESAIVTVPDSEPPADLPADQMRQRLAGVLDVFDRRALAPLLRSPARLVDPQDTAIFALLHAELADERVTFELRRDPAGDCYARREGDVRTIQLPEDTIAPLAHRWACEHQPTPPADTELGRVLEPTPVPSPWTFDTDTLSELFLRGRKTRIAPVERVLETERIFLRFPAGYDPATPAGLLVWVDPSPGGRPPSVFNEALDALGFVCVGAAEAGNSRPVADRYQLAFDAMHTACNAAHIDPARVYVTGMSGGGRVSSTLLGGFPDVFAGAVPIVGLSCYKNVPMGAGRFIQAAFARPNGALLRQYRERRIGAITGDQDFNQLEMRQAVELYTRDRMDIRLFDYEDLGHTLPNAQRFREVLEWVDEPARAAREEAIIAARDRLEDLERVARTPERERAMLAEIIELAPWSEPARAALERLEALDAPEEPAP